MPLQALVLLPHVRDPLEHQGDAQRQQRQPRPQGARGKARQAHVGQQLAEVVRVAGVEEEAGGDELARAEGEGGVLVSCGELVVWGGGVKE